MALSWPAASIILLSLGHVFPSSPAPPSPVAFLASKTLPHLPPGALVSSASSDLSLMFAQGPLVTQVSL